MEERLVEHSYAISDPERLVVMVRPAGPILVRFCNLFWTYSSFRSRASSELATLSLFLQQGQLIEWLVPLRKLV
ncbi:hypothetical protein V6N11_055189 [Hibiscus sabdariffa]|uniref:Uncharacterized protein n=1 Tax=Hibiscus sabdariffa TaxID=183260 RepID=A0ABR2PF11_9ROSI